MKLATLWVLILAIAAPAAAQSDGDKQPGKFYRLDFTIKEIDGTKPVKTHNYQMMVEAIAGKSSIRSGARIPTGDAKGTQFFDIGVNLDVNELALTKDGLEFNIVVEASGVEAGTETQFTKPPMIYQTRWTSKVEIPLRKATVIFSSDDPASKRQLQLEATATPLH